MLTKGYGFLVMSDKEGQALALKAGHVWIGKVKIKAKKVTLPKVKNSADKNSKKPRNDDSTENVSSSPKNKNQNKKLEKPKLSNFQNENSLNSKIATIPNPEYYSVPISNTKR